MSRIRRWLFRILKAIPILLVLGGIAIYIWFPAKIVHLVQWWQRKQAGLTWHQVLTPSGMIPYLEGGAGAPVLLLHGFQDNKESFINFGGQLISKYHVIIPDMHAFGENHETSNGDYTPAAQARRMHMVMKALNITSAHVAGWSMGGQVAAMYAYQFPDETKSLGLMFTAGARPDTVTPIAQSLLAGNNAFHVVDNASLDSLIVAIGDSGFSVPGLVKRVLVAESRRRAAQWDTVFAQMIREDVRYQVDSLAPELRMPTLVAWGSVDKLFHVSAARRLASRLPQAQLVIIEGCGHFCPATKPEELEAAYRKFLDLQH